MIEDDENQIKIIIDSLTNSIREIATGKNFDTELLKVSTIDVNSFSKKKSWHFNWKTEVKDQEKAVFKLVIIDEPEVIQGLVSVSNRGDHYYLNLAEAAPHNFGLSKKHEGVGGNLFAFCCKLSWDSGNDGIIAFKSKTLLIPHYENTLGAVHIGNQNMIIYPTAALYLIDKYFKK